MVLKMNTKKKKKCYKELPKVEVEHFKMIVAHHNMLMLLLIKALLWQKDLHIPA